MYNSVICAIIKDEKNVYLREWIEFHTLIGFQHIYIYDNDSLEPIKKIVAGYDNITVINYPGHVKQLASYANFLQEYGKFCNWCAFIDSDEFIIPKNKNNDINEFLSNYEEFGGIGINWLMFSSSGILEDNDLPQVKKFTKCIPNYHIKSIVKPIRTIGPLTPHNFNYKDGFYCVNELKNPICGHLNEDFSINNCHINHYFLRSLPEWKKKVDRGRADTTNKRSYDEFYKWDAITKYTEITAIKILEKKITSAREIVVKNA